MVSLFRLIFGWLAPNRIILVQRMPAVKAPRATLLGLAMGLTIVFGEAALQAATGMLSQAGSPLWLLVGGAVFVAGSLYLGNWFAFFMLLWPILGGYLTWLGGLAGVFDSFAMSFVTGYAFGWLLAIFYNDISYLIQITFGRRNIRVAFAYDTERAVNIIKSPRPDEEHAWADYRANLGGYLPQDLRETVRNRLDQRRVYQYQLGDNLPNRPYTIVFAANERVFQQNGVSQCDDNACSPDPMANNLDLFLQSVNLSLQALERDPVIGHPAIWSRVRVLTWFPGGEGDIRADLVQEYPSTISIDGQVANNLIDTRVGENGTAEIVTHAIRIGAQTLASQWSGEDPAPASLAGIENDVDVIYAMSAYESHDRSTARYANWIAAPPAINNAHGDLDFSLAPLGQHSPPLPAPEFHEANTIQPGTIALNVLGARTKTVVHEFGHAMSSLHHGAITDEYADRFIDPTAPAAPPADLPIYVNKFEKSGPNDPLPQIFAEFIDCQIRSEQNHPSAEENWLGFFPQQYDANLPCTMDRSHSHHHFDVLLTEFIYRRMMTKINRP